MLSQVFNRFRKTSRKSNKCNRNQAARRRALFMESLEDRRLLAVVNISGGGASNWQLYDQAITTNGLPVGGYCNFGGASGSGHSIGDASIPSQGDAFDLASMIWVNDTQVGGTLSQSGNTVTFSPVSISGLTVQSEYFVLSGSASLREFTTLTNPSGSPITVSVDFANNWGSDGGTAVNGTSSGDTIFTTADRWLVTDDSSTTSGDPANTTVFYGPGSPSVMPSSVFADRVQLRRYPRRASDLQRHRPGRTVAVVDVLSSVE